MGEKATMISSSEPDRRRLRRIGAILAATASMFAFIGPAQPAAARLAMAETCDRPAVITSTMAKLGEHRSTFRIVTPDEMDAENPRHLWGTAGDNFAVYSLEIPCHDLPGVVAHELAHVWQARKYGTMDHAKRAYGAEIEPIADCAGVATGLETDPPYLEDRGYGCTEYERSAARSLPAWAR